MKARILVIDDDEALSEMIGIVLRNDGFDPVFCADGSAALGVFRSTQPDLVLLDLMLPGLPGTEVCRALRARSSVPVIMLTARDDETDLLVGLGVGADDYMTKPFSPRELMARVRVLLRRPRRPAQPPSTPTPRPSVDVGPLRLDLDAREVHLDGVPVPLTRTEFDVLAALASGPGRVFSRRALIETVWGPNWVGDEHLVDVHVLHVRQKLGDSPERQRFVRTVRGVGYRIGTGT